MLNWGVTANRVSSSLATLNDEILHVRGAMADKIVSIGDPLDLALESLAHYSPGDHSHEHCRKVHSSQLAIIKGWKRLCLELSASTYRLTGRPILDAFWRTVFLDRNIVHSIHGPLLACLTRVIDEANVKGVFGWRDGFEFPPKHDEQESDMLLYIRFVALELWNFNRLNPHYLYLRFFTTCRGYLGVGHPNCEPGNKVARAFELFGTIDSSRVSRGAYIGRREVKCGFCISKDGYSHKNSYVHGIMNGEIIRRAIDGDEDRDISILQCFSIV